MFKLSEPQADGNGQDVQVLAGDTFVPMRAILAIDEFGKSNNLMVLIMF